MKGGSVNRAVLGILLIWQLSVLVAEGADADAKDRDGRTSGWYAEKNGHSQVVELLQTHKESKKTQKKTEKTQQDPNQPEQDSRTNEQGGKKIHDVAIGGISASISEEDPETINVAVNVFNQGHYDESVNVILTDTTDGQVVGKQSVSLPYQDEVMDVRVDKIFAENSNKRFGQAVACGDIDNDGYADVVVGTRNYAIGTRNYGRNKGRAYLYYGGPDMNTEVDMIFEGELLGDNFGNSLACSDIDNDGFDDILIGAYNYPAGGGEGRAYLYWGKARASMIVNADLIFDAPDTHAWFSAAIPGFGCGDVDKDGFKDILITGFYYDGHRGRVYLYYGDTKASMDTTCDLIFQGEGVNNLFGITADMGDIDSDGYGDVMIGARQYPSPRCNGRAYFYWGKNRARMNASAELIFDAETDERDFFGQGIAFGDINNDGYNDLVIGAQGHNSFQGRAYLYYGDAKGNFNINPDKTFDGRLNQSDFAWHIKCADINGDDYDDIVIGADRWGPGELFIFFGGANMDETADRILSGENPGDYFSQWFNCADIDNDNCSDLVVGAVEYPAGDCDGRVYLYYGGSSKGSIGLSFNWDATNASKGKHILKAEITPVSGDVDTANNSRTAAITIKDNEAEDKEEEEVTDPNQPEQGPVSQVIPSFGHPSLLDREMQTIFAAADTAELGS